MTKRRTLIEKSFYAERKYLTYKKTWHKLRKLYYFLKWKFYEVRIK